MTPQEAIQFLDNLCSQMSLSRQGHTQVAQAIQVLSAAIGSEPPHE